MKARLRNKIKEQYTKLNLPGTGASLPLRKKLKESEGEEDG
jgi:hypothetical protein